MSVTREQLLKYCQEHDIFVPNKSVPKEYLEAAVTRARFHMTKQTGKNCFGLWDTGAICSVCDHEPECFKVSMGMTKNKYLIAVDKEENPRIRFTEKLSK